MHLGEDAVLAVEVLRALFYLTDDVVTGGDAVEAVFPRAFDELVVDLHLMGLELFVTVLLPFSHAVHGNGDFVAELEVHGPHALLGSPRLEGGVGPGGIDGQESFRGKEGVFAHHGIDFFIQVGAACEHCGSR